MNLDATLRALPYATPQTEKEAALLGALNELTHHHANACPDYGRILSTMYGGPRPAASLADVPYLPVTLFKHRDLLAVRREEVFKVLTSSGTTGAAVSRIYLDRETADRQTRALSSIMSHVLGPRRLPMILIDTRNVIKDRKSFSARGAGILGMMSFGRDHFYALDDEMKLDIEGLRAFLKRHEGSPVLLFGFTFMVWQYFHRALVGQGIQIPEGILIHSGGWKKLQEEAVDNSLFKAALRETAGIHRVYNFYGMVEQVGSVFLECDAGRLHPPSFADIIVRDPVTWAEAPLGKQGVIQVLSALPRSYPGHSLLTEDLGTVLCVDDCPCGRRGKAFEVHGRIPRAELRGCSDTHAYDRRLPA